MRQYPAGRTTAQLSSLTGLTSDAVRKALEKMPDAYISGWIQSYKTPPSAIWAVVIPPANAPKPKYGREATI